MKKKYIPIVVGIVAAIGAIIVGYLNCKSDGKSKAPVVPSVVNNVPIQQNVTIQNKSSQHEGKQKREGKENTSHFGGNQTIINTTNQQGGQNANEITNNY